MHHGKYSDRMSRPGMATAIDRLNMQSGQPCPIYQRLVLSSHPVLHCVLHMESWKYQECLSPWPSPTGAWMLRHPILTASSTLLSHAWTNYLVHFSNVLPHTLTSTHLDILFLYFNICTTTLQCYAGLHYNYVVYWASFKHGILGHPGVYGNLV